MTRFNFMVGIIIFVVGAFLGAVFVNSLYLCALSWEGNCFHDSVSTLPADKKEKACTMEAKLCPDGSYVSRTGPNCEFASCPLKTEPEPVPVSSGACKKDADCNEGYYCADISPVAREGYQNLRCWKKGTPTPICLAGDTKIETSAGGIAVKNLTVGERVWTMHNGAKITAPIIAVAKTSAPDNHRAMHIVLEDGRELLISPGHALADGRLAGDIKLGEFVENTKVLKAELILYSEKFTYDILPAGSTGMYWANGILLRSTLTR